MVEAQIIRIEKADEKEGGGKKGARKKDLPPAIPLQRGRASFV